jgi:membrane-bound serine protease (ClpP class)
MLFVIGTTLAFVFLPWPGRGAVIVVLAAVEVLEVLLWLRLRRMRALTGAEGLVGARGRALTDLAPEGRVKVRGAVWTARSSSEVEAGQDVIVTGMHGLHLEVRSLRPAVTRER